MTVVRELRRSPLHDRHERAGARLVPFAGWELPVQYESAIQSEHRAVRTRVGVFDVSHMGQIETSGPEAAALLQRLLSNDVDLIGVGHAQYSVMCREDGGVLDDLFTYRLDEDRYLTVTNAGNHERDLAWFRAHSEAFAAEVTDRAREYAMLAVQGPSARSLIGDLASAPLPPRLHAARLSVAGVDALVCGTGYTGEDGLELLISPEDASNVWDAVLIAGAMPAGLGARDTLRLEACYHLYGNDLTVERGPIEAGLGWCCEELTGFIGAEAVAHARAAGTAERLVPFKLTSAGVPRPGNEIRGGGTVTSGSFSPSLRAGIGLAYVASERAAPGTALTIDVRGHARDGLVVTRPFYPPAG